jgi:hypothetical protein
MIEEPHEALELVRKCKLVTLTHVDGLVSLVDAVAGERVVGSWWSHPRGGLIFNISQALEDAGDVVVAKLVEGKVTFVHASLWPALYAFVSDAGYRARAQEALSPAAKRLLRAVGERDVRMDELTTKRGADKRALGKAKDEIEKTLSAHTVQLHTERGSHTTVLRAWSRWASAETKRAAADLSWEAAAEALRTYAKAARIGVDPGSSPRSRRT